MRGPNACSGCGHTPDVDTGKSESLLFGPRCSEQIKKSGTCYAALMSNLQHAFARMRAFVASRMVSQQHLDGPCMALFYCAGQR